MEEVAQNGTDVTPPQQEWIDFRAMGGLVIDSDGQVSKKTTDQFSKDSNIPRRTLYNWETAIPDFWEKVKARRNELYARDAVTIIYKSMLKKAAGGDVQAAKLILQQARVLEAEKIDHTTNGKDLPTPIVSLDALRTNNGN